MLEEQEMPSTDLGYLFGCCAACRAPFEPSRALTPEEQSVLYMIARFEQLSSGIDRKSEFSASKHNSHIVSRAKYGPALAWASRLDAGSIDADLPGWDGGSNQPNFSAANMKRMFIAPASSSARGRKAIKDAETGELDPEAKNAIKNARQDAIAAGDDDDFAESILQSLSLTSDGLYHATWKKPATRVVHNRLAEWLKGAELEAVDVNFDRTTACCILCNNIWDCWARMRATFQSRFFMEPACVAVKDGKKKYVDFPNDSDSSMLSRLGSMVAYYLHSSLLQLKKSAVPDPAFEALRRPATVVLVWLPLHVNCMYRELDGPITSPNNPRKGFHNYAGCLDLLISYYLYICACADPEVKFGGFPFERFHVFYVKELSECPSPVWPDPVNHARLQDYVFNQDYFALGDNYGRQVSHVSDRLQQLYHDVVKPVAIFAQGVEPNPGLDASGRDFFLSHDEAQALTHDYLEKASASVSNIQPHLARAGVHAIMWQLRRALQRENEVFPRELDRWINARMQVEWRNIAASGATDGLFQAQLLYYAQHTTQPLAWLDAESDDGAAGVVARLASHGRCSIWKAALRLRAYNFTVPAASAEIYEEDDDGGSDGLAARFQGLRIAGPGRQLRIAGPNRQLTLPAPKNSARSQLTKSPAAAARETPARSQLTKSPAAAARETSARGQLTKSQAAAARETSAHRQRAFEAAAAAARAHPAGSRGRSSA